MTKFRVWDNIQKVMDYSTQWAIRSDGVLYYGNAKFDTYDCIILLCTGLTDMHGKDIYDGDILNFNIRDKVYCGYVVTWIDYEYAAINEKGERIEIWMSNKAVVGNKYEG